MLVCGHGNIDDFCKRRGMKVHARYDGDIADYDGKSGVLVTNEALGRAEYLQLKTLLCMRGSDLILARETRRGRYRFGFDGDGMTDEGRKVVSRILELRDAGYTLNKIRDDEVVRHPCGRRLCIGTINRIVVDREFYEKEGL